MRKLFIFIIPLLLISCKEEQIVYQKLQGNAFGTTFDIIYEDSQNRDFSKSIDSIIYKVNKSLSTYIYASDISKINRGDSTIVVDELFVEVFEKSNKIYKETDGLFDPTVGVLVNAWGFGPEKAIENLTADKINELMKFVGFDKVRLRNGKIIKEHSEIYFDFNAIAKGYGIDVIGRFIENKNCVNYRIELGGEIRARGTDPNEKLWRVWLDEPNVDGTRTLEKYVQLDNQSMASSGNYRHFNIDDTGNKYVHTINTKTGMATESNLLAATVISKLDCADVDGYATAFMAMGFEKTIEFLKSHPELEVYLIYLDKNGNTKTYQSEDLLITDRQ
jgi:thiamine biosynthesis lipoprotein